jgi:acyl-CoA thioester hydrolase
VGWDHTETTGQSGFVVGCKVTCLRRLRVGDPIAFEFIVADVDDKRNHVLTCLRHGSEGWLAATQEQLNVCVDFTTRRTAVWHPSSRPVLEAFRAAQRDWPRPVHLSQPVGRLQVNDAV